MLITSAIIFVVSVVLWILYCLAFREQPDKGITAVIVAFTALCVLGVKGVINRLRKKEKKI